MTFRPLSDNVLIVLEPEPTETKGGVAIVRQRGPSARYSRTARVIASGPGYRGRSTYLNPAGLFHPNVLKPGDRVLVDALAGNNWDFDVGEAPRNNGADTSVPFLAAVALLGSKVEARIIREAEALAVLEDDVVASNDMPTPPQSRWVDLNDPKYDAPAAE
jgi:co-chaperonin GroES (HSP10)